MRCRLGAILSTLHRTASAQQRPHPPPTHPPCWSLQGEQRSPEVLDAVLGGRPLLCLGACAGGALITAWPAGWSFRVAVAAVERLLESLCPCLNLCLPPADIPAAFDNMHMEVQPPEPWHPKAAAGAAAGSSGGKGGDSGSGPLRPAAA